MKIIFPVRKTRLGLLAAVKRHRLVPAGCWCPSWGFFNFVDKDEAIWADHAACAKSLQANSVLSANKGHIKTVSMGMFNTSETTFSDFFGFLPCSGRSLVVQLKPTSDVCRAWIRRGSLPNGDPLPSSPLISLIIDGCSSVSQAITTELGWVDIDSISSTNNTI